MSASLVGSEMCIRDRANAPRTPRLAPLARAASPGGLPPDGQMGSGACATCLLYTSDAADDM
eukprot:6249940-Alexandrium_andersonii.AAC.1